MENVEKKFFDAVARGAGVEHAQIAMTLLLDLIYKCEVFADEEVPFGHVATTLRQTILPLIQAIVKEKSGK